MREALVLLVLLFAPLLPVSAADGPFKRIKAGLAEIFDPRDPTSVAGCVSQGSLAYSCRHGQLPSSREHLEEGLRSANLPTAGLDGLHDLQFTSKGSNHVYITGRYKKGRVEAPLRINLKVDMEEKAIKALAKRSVMSANHAAKKPGT